MDPCVDELVVDGEEGVEAGLEAALFGTVAAVDVGVGLEPGGQVFVAEDFACGEEGVGGGGCEGGGVRGGGGRVVGDGGGPNFEFYAFGEGICA